MRTSAIFAFVFLASLIVPTFASAGSTPPNGVCYNDTDCVTGYNCPPAVGLAINRTCLATVAPAPVAPAKCVTPCVAADGYNGSCNSSGVCISYVSQIPTGSSSTPKPNGVGCAAPSDCTSGYCSPGNASSRVCAVKPTSTGGIQPSGGGNVLTPTQPSGGGNGTNVTLINPLKSGTSLTSFLNNILDFVINVGSIIVILMLVFVGFKFVLAQGKDAALVEARKMLLWTIIGALVLLGAKAISAGILATVQSLGG